MPLERGARLGPYEIHSPLGAGGMGEVYRAFDSRLARPVAIKILAPHLTEDAVALARFQAEARAIASLSHPNILSIFELDDIGGMLFAVTELLEGQTLHSLLRQTKPPWRRALEIAIDVAEGLAAAHSREIVHRDIKPQNIFVTVDGRAKVLDFGLAQSRQPFAGDAADDEVTSPLHDGSGEVIGSMGYMSPEQLRGERAGPSSDIFSLGCVLFEMISGRRCFAKPSMAETIGAILYEEPPAIQTGQGSPFPLEIIDVVARCLEKNPLQRFQSARDLSFALQMIASSSGEIAAALPPPRPRPAERGSSGVDSLAILPFVNSASDQAAEYLSDGLTETLIQLMSDIPSLRVMARSTVFRYKRGDFDPLEVGRRLGVRGILVGRLTCADDLIDVDAELVDTADGSRLWGSRYHRKLADVLVIQEEIAHEIAEKLRIRLTGEDRKRLSKKYTADPEAYRLYLKGRYQWNERTEESLRDSIASFEAAIARDPQYALAYAGLADAYSILANFGFARPRETFPLATAAARTALEIDDTLAEAYTALAFVHDLFDYDPRAAEAAFREAIQRKSNYATAHHWYGVFLSGQQRRDEAVARIRRAHELDPLSPIINAELGLPDLHVRRFDEALTAFNASVDMFPDFAPAHALIGHATAQLGRYDEAITAYRQALEYGTGAEGKGWLAHALFMAGEVEEGERILAELLAIGDDGITQPASVSLALLASGRREEALDAIQFAYAERSLYPQMLLDARFDPLLSDRTFAKIERRVRRR